MFGEQVHSAAIVLYVLSVFSLVVEHTEKKKLFQIYKKECRNSHASVLDFNITGLRTFCVFDKKVVVSCFDSLGIISERDMTILQSVIEESNSDIVLLLTVDLSKQHKNEESRSKEHRQDGGSRT
uniref:Uncharacterized protein n=1 Tax=Meloidogyne incognita TaxID=6306 RepID=A0A914NW91_MELIC